MRTKAKIIRSGPKRSNLGGITYSLPPFADQYARPMIKIDGVYTYLLTVRGVCDAIELFYGRPVQSIRFRRWQEGKPKVGPDAIEWIGSDRRRYHFYDPRDVYRWISMSLEITEILGRKTKTAREEAYALIGELGMNPIPGQFPQAPDLSRYNLDHPETLPKHVRKYLSSIEKRKARLEKKMASGQLVKWHEERKQSRDKRRMFKQPRIAGGNPFAQIPLTRDQVRYRAKKEREALARGEYFE